MQNCVSVSCNNMKCFTEKKDLRFVGHKVRVTVFRERMFIGRVGFVRFACEMCEYSLCRQLCLHDLLSPSEARRTFTPRSLDFRTPACVQTSLISCLSLSHCFALTHFLLRLFLKAECIFISKRKCAQIRSVVFPFFFYPLCFHPVFGVPEMLCCVPPL